MNSAADNVFQRKQGPQFTVTRGVGFVNRAAGGVVARANAVAGVPLRGGLGWEVVAGTVARVRRRRESTRKKQGLIKGGRDKQG